MPVAPEVQATLNFDELLAHFDNDSDDLRIYRQGIKVFQADDDLFSNIYSGLEGGRDVERAIGSGVVRLQHSLVNGQGVGDLILAEQ